MLIIKAINFAAQKHKGQTRRETGLPYLVHPMLVSELITKYKGTSKDIDNLKCAALLHDVLEDTVCTYHEIEREFNPLIASIVMELTSDEEKIKEMTKNEYLKLKMINMSKYAFILKLLDRLSNVMDSPSDKYLKNTIDLMNHLLDSRKDITDRQIRIINEILTICNEI